MDHGSRDISGTAFIWHARVDRTAERPYRSLLLELRHPSKRMDSSETIGFHTYIAWRCRCGIHPV
jgi:hypothetical protein